MVRVRAGLEGLNPLARLVVLWHYKTMKSINETKKLKKGRPSVDTEAVNLRLQRDLLTALDGFRRDEDDLPNRPEALRRITSDWLREKGYLPK